MCWKCLSETRLEMKWNLIPIINDIYFGNKIIFPYSLQIVETIYNHQVTYGQSIFRDILV